MELPTNAKVWAAVLALIFLIILSGVVYIAFREEEKPAPSNDTLNKHLESLQIRAEKKMEKELDKAISR
jgi:hypothetical protein